MFHSNAPVYSAAVHTPVRGADTVNKVLMSRLRAVSRCAARLDAEVRFSSASPKIAHPIVATRHVFFFFSSYQETRLHRDSLHITSFLITAAILQLLCTHTHISLPPPLLLRTPELYAFAGLIVQRQETTQSAQTRRQYIIILTAKTSISPAAIVTRVCVRRNYLSSARPALSTSHTHTHTPLNMATWRQHPLGVGGRHYNSLLHF